MWDVLIHNHLWKKKVCVPITGGGSKDEAYVGAYVKEPLVGAHQWVLSFDLDSLYPHLIMQYNISPETLDRVNRVDITVDNLLDANYQPPLREGYSLAANGRYFSNQSQGFLPEMMERMYESRSEYKRKMIEAQKAVESAKTPQEKRDHEKSVSRYKNMQLAKKVQLNSAYGAIGNPYFRFYDLNQATAITVGGQLSIRWAEVKINEYINKLLGTEDVDYVIAVDTDSLYITLDGLVTKVFKDKTPTTEQIVTYLDKIASQAFKPVIDKIYAGLHEHMNAFAQKMSMKRENIADRGIWTGKKRYILNVHDSEGVRYETPKLKMMGIEAVKSSTPAFCRKAIKDALNIIMTKDESAMHQFIASFREQFNKMRFEDIAFPRGIQGLGKYRMVEKGIPIHVRASQTYNTRLKQLKLDKTYDLIKDGDKVKFCYMKMPNPLNENVLAIASVLPSEFEIDRYIDYKTQFEKAFLDPLRSILDVIGWQDEDRPTLEKFFT
jgi:DNA polymerase elongation subunit (family B)